MGDLSEYMRNRVKRKGLKFIEDRNSYHHVKIKWEKTKCNHCGRKILYVRKQDWDGKLRCTGTDCGKEFIVPSLDGFLNP